MRATQPLVSVITPMYRAARFLDETIESVWAQSYSHWELILVDDAGGDESAAIAAAHVTRNPARIKLLSHPNAENRGASASRNLAISQAHGAYIALLDADDVWHPTKLEEQVELMQSHSDVGMLYGNSLYWYSWTDSAAEQARDRIPALGVAGDTVFDPPELLTRCLQGTIAVPCPCSVVLRREAVDRAGGFEKGFVGVNASSEDLAFFAKLMLRERVLVANHVWDRYRRHPDSVYERAKADGTAAVAYLHYLEWLREYLTRSKVSDARLTAALKSAIKSASGSDDIGLTGRMRRATSRVIEQFRTGRDQDT